MNDVDNLVLRFRESDNGRERNNIFKVIREIYLPKFYNKRNNYNKRFWDDLDSEYDYQIFRAMIKWNPHKGTMFTTYLYIWATVKPFSSVNEKIISKSYREPSFSSLGWNDEYDEDN